MDPILQLILGFVALVFGLVDAVRAGAARSWALTSWGVVALALIVVVANWDAVGS